MDLAWVQVECTTKPHPSGYKLVGILPTRELGYRTLTTPRTTVKNAKTSSNVSRAQNSCRRGNMWEAGHANALPYYTRGLTSGVMGLTATDEESEESRATK